MINLPQPGELAKMTPEQLKGFLDQLQGEKETLSRNQAIYETQRTNYEDRKRQAEQSLIEVAGSADPDVVNAFIENNRAEAEKALEQLRQLMNPTTEQQAQPSAPAAPAAAANPFATDPQTGQAPSPAMAPMSVMQTTI